MKNSCFWRAFALVAIIFCLEVVKGKKVVIIIMYKYITKLRKKHGIPKGSFLFFKTCERNYENQISSALASCKVFHILSLKIVSLRSLSRDAINRSFKSSLERLKLSYHKTNWNWSIDRFISQSTEPDTNQITRPNEKCTKVPINNFPFPLGGPKNKIFYLFFIFWIDLLKTEQIQFFLPDCKLKHISSYRCIDVLDPLLETTVELKTCFKGYPLVQNNLSEYKFRRKYLSCRMLVFMWSYEAYFAKLTTFYLIFTTAILWLFIGSFLVLYFILQRSKKTKNICCQEPHTWLYSTPI